MLVEQFADQVPEARKYAANGCVVVGLPEPAEDGDGEHGHHRPGNTMAGAVDDSDPEGPIAAARGKPEHVTADDVAGFPDDADIGEAGEQLFAASQQAALDARGILDRIHHDAVCVGQLPAALGILTHHVAEECRVEQDASAGFAVQQHNATRVKTAVLAVEQRAERGEVTIERVDEEVLVHQGGDRPVLVDGVGERVGHRSERLDALEHADRRTGTIDDDDQLERTVLAQARDDRVAALGHWHRQGR